MSIPNTVLFSPVNCAGISPRYLGLKTCIMSKQQFTFESLNSQGKVVQLLAAIRGWFKRLILVFFSAGQKRLCQRCGSMQAVMPATSAAIHNSEVLSSLSQILVSPMDCRAMVFGRKKLRNSTDSLTATNPEMITI